MTKEYENCSKCRHFTTKIEGISQYGRPERPKRRVYCDKDMLSTKGTDCPMFDERGLSE